MAVLALDDADHAAALALVVLAEEELRLAHERLVDALRADLAEMPQPDAVAMQLPLTDDSSRS